MKIGIAAYVISHGPPGGFRTYTLNLIKHLAEIDAENEYLIYTNRNIPEGLLQPNFRARVCPARNLLFWEQIALPKSLQRDSPDIIHFPANTAPVRYTGKGIVTIHDTNLFETDLLRLKTPKSLKSRLLSRYHIWNIPYTARNASAIITDSEHSRKRIVENLKIPEEKIKVIYEAADGCYRLVEEKDQIQEVRQKFNLTSRFILGLGSIDPRKNVTSTIQAFQRLEGLVRDYQLVIVWSQGKFTFNRSREHRLADGVVYLSQVSDQDLLLLYNAAEVFIFPSLYEGFGLPPLEAMACGTPVITSNTSSLPEIVGDAVLMVNPLHIDELAEAMYKVLSEPQLQEEMKMKGLRQAQKFSWNKTARETLQFYKEVFDKE